MVDIRQTMALKPLLIGLGLLCLGLGMADSGRAQDLTPSVNYFNFDYGSIAVNSTMDSIIAGRYEALVADGSYGTAYVAKYNDLVAYDPDLEIYIYHNFNDPYYSSAGLPPVNEYVGPRMVADGEDSTEMYWHSEDYTVTDFGHYEAYATSEMGSRLLTYNGTRALVNNTNLNFIHHFVDYAAEIQARHSGRNYEIAGLWFDNMNLPQTVGVGTGTANRHIHEAKLGGPYAQYGAWTISEWQQNYKDTVLIKYMAVLGDSLLNRLGLKVCINALAWAYGDKDSYAGGYQPEYFVGDLVKPVHREYEFGIQTYDHNEQLLYPGPTNSASSINPATDASDYSPASIYIDQVACSQHDVENWFSPGHGYLEYGFRDYWYDCLAMYYVIRSRTTFISFANVPETRLGVLNWLDGGASNGHCVHAGQAGDSCYWIDALGVRVGRDGKDAAWDNDVVDWYAASVDCQDCIVTDGQGKDNDSQNWIVFRRRWTGDDGYDYMALLRPPGRYQEQFAGSQTPSFPLVDGPWQKLSHDGTWGAPQSTETLENARGGIYRTAAGECSSPPSVPTLASPPDYGEAGTLQPGLCVNNSTPAVGCSEAQTYQFEVYTDVDLTNRVVGPVTSSEGASQTCLTVSPALSSGRWYWWRARAFNGTAYSAWAGPFAFSTPNTPPTTPQPVSPADGSEIDDSQPTFVVSSASDPDGTSLMYYFQLSDQSDFGGLMDSVVTVDQTNWTTSLSLSNGQYYWRARCYDGIDSSSWCDGCGFTVAVGGGNNPPTLSMMVTPVDGDTTPTSSPTLSIVNGTDPDGDDLTYSFQLYDATQSSLLAQVTNVSEGTSSTSWEVPLSLAINADYYWRVRCYDGIAYSSWTGMASFHVVSENACDVPPGAPSPTSPNYGSDAGTLSPILCVDNSDPAPGCSELQTYEFEVYSNGGLSTQVGTTITVAEGTNVTCAAVDPPLKKGRWFWWRARANNGSTYSQWSETYRFHTPNQPPPEPAPIEPTGGATVVTRQPTILTGVSEDPDSTEVEYMFEVSTSSGFSSIVASGSASGPEWSVSPALSDNSTYYWRARANDQIDTSSYNTTSWFRVNTATNDPPGSPDHYVPIDGETLLDTPIVLVVNNAVDPDGDPLLYDFYLYDDSTLSYQVDEQINVTEGNLQTSATFFSGSLPVNLKRYYWHVLVHDDESWSSPSDPTWFRYYSFATDADAEVPAVVSPAEGSTVSATSPVLMVANITEPGEHNYFFDVALDSLFVTSAAASPAIAAGDNGFTEWTVTPPLQTGVRYYWRARADSYDYSPTASFVVDARIYASPNPVSFTEGQPLTFHLPAEPIDLMIQTVSGEAVIVVRDISGDWDWNGINDAGHRVAAGVYLWYVRGTDYHGKVIVKP